MLLARTTIIVPTPMTREDSETLESFTMGKVLLLDVFKVEVDTYLKDQGIEDCGKTGKEEAWRI